MENNLVRTEDLFGSRKNIVGNNTSDLILETLGKIYVKTGNKTRVLNDVFKLLDGINKDNAGSKTIITTNLESLKYPGDGYLVFATSENALYISYDLRYLLVIDSIDKEVVDQGFVQKKGDTMTGPLKITHRGAPLIVASSLLVKNLNANYLEGHKAKYFASKELDELISGHWTFDDDADFNLSVDILKNLSVGEDSHLKRNLTVEKDSTLKGELEVRGKSVFNDTARFKDNASFDKDIVLNGSIGSSQFMSGYLGYGWRFDAETNMLTVDYLVVRKAMHVFELVVNKVTATNGSLWVTDSAKIKEVYDVRTLPIERGFNALGVSLDTWYIPYKNNFNKSKIRIPTSYLKRPEDLNLDNSDYLDFDIFKFICLYTKDNNTESINLETDFNKIGVLFSEAYTTEHATHFNRTKGFKTNLSFETPIYIYESEPLYRAVITLGEATHVYDENTKTYRPANNGETALYALEYLSMYVPALEGQQASFRYNSVTKHYEECPPDDPRAKYVYNNRYPVYVLANAILELPTHTMVSYLGNVAFIEYRGTHSFKYDYIETDNGADHVATYRLADKATHIYVESLNNGNGGYILADSEYATHVYDRTLNGGVGGYRIASKATHGLENVYTTLSNNKRYVYESVYTADGKFNGFEFRLAKEDETPTHGLELMYTVSANTLEYVFDAYVPASAGQIATHKKVLEFYEDSTLNSNGERAAKYVYNPLTQTYVKLTDLEAPRFVFSNFKLSEGIDNATHVYVPESYIAPASNLDLPTHILVNGNYLTYGLYLISLDNDILNNKIFNINYTPKLLTVDRNLELVTSLDIKNLALFYKYFGIISNDDIWKLGTPQLLSNIKVIKMEDDEYPPFKEGDLVRCLKFLDGNIKYYDGIIASKLDTYTYIIIKAGSVFDKQTTIEYNEDGTVKLYKEELNTNLYSKTKQQTLTGPQENGSSVGKEGFSEQSLIDGPEVGDGLVRIGHLFDRDRQNSVYITSSEMDSPYIQTISGVNRPDYSVLYAEPDFITNNRGLYEFSADNLQIIDSHVQVKTPNGSLYFLTAQIEGNNGTKKTVFYAPNNNYHAVTNSGEVFLIANYNPNKVKQNTNVRTRLGNLNGITDSMFGDKLPYGYGLFADNVFLKGEFYLNNGKTVVEFSKEQAAIESLKIALKAVAKNDNIFYANDGDDYSEIINNNLLSNTNFDYVSNPTKNWTISSSGTVVTKGFGEYNSFKSNVGSSEIARITIPTTLKAGETYTLSMYAKNTHTSGAATGILFGVPGKEVSGSYQRLWTSVYENGISIGTLFSNRADIYFNSTPDWLRKILVFKMNDDAPDISGAFITFYQWDSDSTNGNYGEWALLKLEIGDTATKYCKNYLDYIEGDPSKYVTDVGRWIPIRGFLQKSEIVDSNNINFIKGLTSDGAFKCCTISQKPVKLVKNQSVHVLLECLDDYLDEICVSLCYIKEGLEHEIGELKSIKQGKFYYLFSDFSGLDGEYYLSLTLEKVDYRTALKQVYFKEEIASISRIGTEASITIENGEITTKIENSEGQIYEKIETVENSISAYKDELNGKYASFELGLDGLRSEVAEVEEGMSVISQRADEISMEVGKYYLFERFSLAKAKINNWGISHGTRYCVDGDRYILKNGVTCLGSNYYEEDGGEICRGVTTISDEGMEDTISIFFDPALLKWGECLNFIPFKDIPKGQLLVIEINYSGTINDLTAQIGGVYRSNQTPPPLGEVFSCTVEKNKITLSRTLMSTLKKDYSYSLILTGARGDYIDIPVDGINTNQDIGSMFELTEDAITSSISGITADLENVKSEIKQTAESIELSVSKDDLNSVGINIDTEKITLKGNTEILGLITSVLNLNAATSGIKYSDSSGTYSVMPKALDFTGDFTKYYGPKKWKRGKLLTLQLNTFGGREMLATTAELDLASPFEGTMKITNIYFADALGNKVTNVTLKRYGLTDVTVSASKFKLLSIVGQVNSLWKYGDSYYLPWSGEANFDMATRTSDSTYKTTIRIVCDISTDYLYYEVDENLWIEYEILYKNKTLFGKDSTLIYNNNYMIWFGPDKILAISRNDTLVRAVRFSIYGLLIADPVTVLPGSDFPSLTFNSALSV